jgi:hypothetical protein
MGLVARPYVAAAALAVGSLVVATIPVSTSLPGVHVPDIQLSADAGGIVQPLPNLQDVHGDFTAQPLSPNTDLGPIELQQIPTDGASNTLNEIDPQVDLDKMIVDVQELLNTAIGVDLGTGGVPPVLSGADPGSVFNGGSFGGGTLGADNQGATTADITALPAADAVVGIEAARQAFIETLVQAELDFNHSLVSNESAQAADVFGADSPLTGVANGLFNLHNAILASYEHGLNSMLGANGYVDQLQDSLVVGGDDSEFGDLAARLGQDLGALSSVLGFDSDDWSTVFGLQPEQLIGFFNAASFGDFFTDLLPGLDWSSLFLG